MVAVRPMDPGRESGFQHEDQPWRWRAVSTGVPQLIEPGTGLTADDPLEAGHEVVGVVSVLDRLAGGGKAIEAAAGAPYFPLVTIDDLYPERPDRD